MVRRRSPAHGTLSVKVPPTERREFLPFAPPALGQEEIDAVVDTLRSPWITTGPKVQRFEKEFRAYLNAPGALAVNSCTAALHTALICLGIGPGDEVVTTPITFAATVNVIEHTGARPVLADVSPTTLNIDPAAIATVLSPRTRAIIPVHFAGHPAHMDEIDALAAQNRLHVIEDAAHALPAAYRGHRIGARRNPTAFSFYATKNLTTGEGGMLTGDVEFLERARIVSLHGMSRDAWKRYGNSAQWFYEITEPGFKYNMTDIQAAIGIVQLAKLGQLHERRCQIAAMYTAAFADEEALELPVTEPGIDHAWHLYVLRFRHNTLRIDRNRFIDELTRRRIGTSVHFIPIHLHPYYRDRYGYEPQAFPIAYDSYERMLSIPLNPRMSDQDAMDVIENVLDVIDEFRR
jgi:dTDP-4-amino-4,6-dideoxygalactose transaminase